MARYKAGAKGPKTFRAILTADWAAAEGKLAALLLDYEGVTWRTFMEPPVTRRLPLDLVAQWWGEAQAWRTVLLYAGRGDAYDGHPSGRVPRSTVRTKFPWLTLDDETDLVPLIRAEARRRGLTDIMKEIRRWA